MLQGTLKCKKRSLHFDVVDFGQSTFSLLVRPLDVPRSRRSDECSGPDARPLGMTPFVERAQNLIHLIDLSIEPSFEVTYSYASAIVRALTKERETDREYRETLECVLCDLVSSSARSVCRNRCQVG